MEWHHPTSPQKKAVKATTSAEKSCPMFLGHGRGDFWYTFCHVVKVLTPICIHELLKPCSSLPRELNFTKISNIHNFENIGSRNKTWMKCSSPPIIQARSCTLGFPTPCSPQRCHLWEQVRDDKVTDEVKKWL
jgi:hypothetical protein